MRRENTVNVICNAKLTAKTPRDVCLLSGHHRPTDFIQQIHTKHTYTHRKENGDKLIYFLPNLMWKQAH